jgi:hypothetical protein
MGLTHQIKLPKVNTFNYIVQKTVYTVQCTIYTRYDRLCMGRVIFRFFLSKLYYLVGLRCTYCSFRKHIQYN